MLIFIGTQQDGPAQGIVAARLDAASGVLTTLGVVAEVARPTWVLADPVRPILYAVSSLGNKGECDAEVLSFAIVGSGLRLISRTSSGGGGATHLALNPPGTHLFVANFGGGQVATIPVAADGSLDTALSIQTNYGSGPHPRQTGPHAHGVTLDPSGRFLLVPDMGADRLFVYRYDSATGALSPADPACVATPPGTGPRKVVFGRDGHFAWLLTELTAQIYTYRWDAIRATLTEAGHIALDTDLQAEGRSGAVLLASRDGRFLYASNRRTSQLHVLTIDSKSGLLTDIQQIDADGAKPWGAELSPDGRWLVVANQASDSLALFAVDPSSGMLSPTGASLPVAAPTGVAFQLA